MELAFKDGYTSQVKVYDVIAGERIPGPHDSAYELRDRLLALIERHHGSESYRTDVVGIRDELTRLQYIRYDDVQLVYVNTKKVRKWVKRNRNRYMWTVKQLYFGPIAVRAVWHQSEIYYLRSNKYLLE